MPEREWTCREQVDLLRRAWKLRAQRRIAILHVEEFRVYLSESACDPRGEIIQGTTRRRVGYDELHRLVEAAEAREAAETPRKDAGWEGAEFRERTGTA